MPKPLRRLPLALLAYAQAGYPLLLAAWARVERPPPLDEPPAGALPPLSLVIAAHDEERVIEAKVRNALAQGYPGLEVVVACDGCTDATAERARAAGAHAVLELPRGGKVRTQDAGVERARGEVVAFSDANALLEPGALRELVAPFADRSVGYVCGQVTFVNDAGTNQEGLYWRYEMAVRSLESRLASVTGGNGALYATRREAYLVVDPVMGHDLSFPFNLVRRGWRCVYRPGARATEKMVPSIEGEWARKRRMMSHAWPIVVRGGLLDPRGWPPRYALMIASHRWLRYAAPFLHVLSLRSPASRGAHAALAAAALAAPRVPLRPLLVARYYLLTQASIAFGLYDWLRHGTDAGWDQAEGTR
ncbi:MAG TPA: glycosyltransferase family 2 protein [Solirubrobacteraceae bacterium]|nr:glycosyltransferase family 2 protein [Solirubrobacteraceae bacterium]